MPKTIEELESDISTLESKHAGEIAQKDTLIETAEKHATKLSDEVKTLKNDLKSYRDIERKTLEDAFHSLPLADADKKKYTSEIVKGMPDGELKVFVDAFTMADAKHSTKKTPSKRTQMPGSTNDKDIPRVDKFLNSL